MKSKITQLQNELQALILGQKKVVFAINRLINYNSEGKY